MIEVNPSNPAATPASTDTVKASTHKRNLQTAQEALVAEFHTLVGDTEKLLKQTGDMAGTHAEELRTKITANLGRAKELLKETEGTLREQCGAAVQATEEYVHAKPLQSIGIAAGVGFLLGLLVGRR